MKAKLRKAVSSNIILYTFWFLLVRKRKGLDADFFQRDTDVYIDGYERSGNTFIIHLMRHVLPELNTVDHLHVVAPIKIALLLNLPVFILIRNPMDCISSKYLKHFAMRDLEIDTKIDRPLLEQFILDYRNYYQFVKNNQHKLHILNFDELIESPERAIREIQDCFDLEDTLLEEKISQAVSSYRGARDTLGSSRPNPEKEKYKALVKKQIIKSDNYMEVVELYDSITNHS